MKNIINRYLIILLLVVLNLTCFSQKYISISGIITQQNTGEVISNANVKIEQVASVSNNYGYYSIKLKQGKYTVQVSKVGFTLYSKEHLLTNDTILNVFLNEGIELSEINVLKNYSVNKAIGKNSLDLSLLKSTPLFLGERDIIKNMQFLPGVSSGMEGSSQLNIRGGTNDQTLYLMDDVPVYNQNHTLGFLSIFNSEALLNAELYKGGIPSNYGNRLSGVVNVSLKDGNYSEHHQSYSMGLLAVSAEFEGPIKKGESSYMFAVRRSIIDLLYKGTLYLTNDMETYNAILIAFYDINAKLSWRLNPTSKLSWQVYNGYDDLYLVNKGISKSNSLFKEKYGQGWSTLTSSLRLSTSLKSNLFLTNSFYYSTLNNLKYSNYTQDTSYFKQKKISLLNEIGLRSFFENKLTNFNTLLYGVDASIQFYTPNKQVEFSNSLKSDYKYDVLKLNTLNVFVSNDLRLNSATITTGIRVSGFNNSSKTIFAIEPRLKFNYFLNSNNKIMFAYEMMHQPINSINEMNYAIQSDFWIPFKEDILPFSNQISVGWKNNAFKNMTISLEAYYKKMENLISILNLENYIDNHTDFEVGYGKSKGIELMIEYSKNRINTSLSYALTKSTRSFDGNIYPFKYDAPHSLSGFLSYVFDKNKSYKNSFSMNVHYNTGYPYHIPILNYPSMFLDIDINIDEIPKYPNIRLSNYFRLDLNFTSEKKLLNGRRVWQFSILNATAQQNPYTVYKTNDNNYKAFVLIPILPSISYSRYF